MQTREATARKRKPTQAPETPAEKFVRLANSRMNNVIREIRVLGNLGNPAYQPTPEQVAQMHKAIMSEIDQAFARIDGRNLGVGFRLKDH